MKKVSPWWCVGYNHIMPWCIIQISYLKYDAAQLWPSDWLQQLFPGQLIYTWSVSWFARDLSNNLHVTCQLICTWTASWFARDMTADLHVICQLICRWPVSWFARDLSANLHETFPMICTWPVSWFARDLSSDLHVICHLICTWPVIWFARDLSADLHVTTCCCLNQLLLEKEFLMRDTWLKVSL